MKIKLLLFIFLVTSASYSQSLTGFCDSDRQTELRRLQDPAYDSLISSLDRDFRNNFPNRISGGSTILNIPLVFHILSDSASVFVNDSDVVNQVEALNIRYSHIDPDSTFIDSMWMPFVGRSSIRFCLAEKDSSGNPFNGIIRRNTNHGIFQSPWDVYDTSSGGDLMWDPSRYFNVYVCRLPSGTGGFATLATQPACVQPELVGSIVIFGKGSTLVHEIGHTFYLRHTWGVNGLGCNQIGDQIADTPPQGGPISGCPFGPLYDSCTTTGIGLNIQNHMDYSLCPRMFTQGQVTWMENYVMSNYTSLLTSNACSFITGSVDHIGKNSALPYPNPSTGIFNIPYFRLSSVPTVLVMDMQGKDVHSLITYSDKIINLDLSELPNGIYVCKLITDKIMEYHLLMKFAK
jgi:hypothetical protein